MFLYKFIEKEYFNDFFNKGSLRLGTVYDYKDIVEHGASRGDSSEGEHRLVRNIDGTIVFSNEKPEPIISEFFKIKDGGKAFVSNVSLVAPRRSEDGFLFCTSYIYHETLFKRWYAEERLDSCYVITNPRGFISAINNRVSSSAKFFRNENVTYTEEEIDYLSPHAELYPAFTKMKTKYEWQLENRSIWGAIGPCGPLKPWVLEVPEAIQYCRPFSFLEDNKIVYSEI